MNTLQDQPRAPRSRRGSIGGDYDVIVIGSGIGGMTAALGCARKGRSVLVLEAAKQLGGFVNPFQRKRFWFDTGIHYVGEAGPGQSLHRQFERLGLLEHLQFRELDPDGFDRYVFPDYETRLCKGPERWRGRLLADFPAEGRGIDRFFALLAKVEQIMRNAPKLPAPGALWAVLKAAPALARYGKATFKELLDDVFTDPRLKAAVSGPGGDIGLPPGRASAVMMMGVLAHFLGGAYFPVGGTKGVRDAYVKALRAHGAELRRNQPVAEILVEGGRAVGVRTVHGDEARAPIVISNADVATTYGELLPAEHQPRRLRRRVAGAEYSLGSLCVFIGTDLQPQEHGLTDANIWDYPSYDIDALYEPAFRGEVGSDLPFFMTVPTLKDPSASHAPEGKHTVELITFAPWSAFEGWQHQKTLKRDADYVALKQRIADGVIARAERHLPGLSSHMEVCEVGTPLTNRSFVNTTQGHLYGLAHTPEQTGLGRFRTVGPVGGLYLCGADVFGAGIATCVSSGAAASKVALEREARARRWSVPRLPRLARL